MSRHRIRGIKMIEEVRREHIARREYQQDIYLNAILQHTTILPEHAIYVRIKNEKLKKRKINRNKLKIYK